MLLVEVSVETGIVNLQGEGGREEGRKGGREGGRKGGREGGGRDMARGGLSGECGEENK